MVAKLINDLPQKFDTFRQTYFIQDTSGNMLTFEQLRIQLGLIEPTIDHTSMKPEIGEALVANKKSSGRGGQKRREDRECFYYKKKGDIKKNCRKFKSDSASGTVEASSQEAAAVLWLKPR